MSLKKFFISSILIFGCLTLFAGDFANDDFILIDTGTDIAYYSVPKETNGKKNGSLFSGEVIGNVQINNISAKSKKYIFPNNKTYEITLFIFEEFVQKDGTSIKKIFKTGSNRYYEDRNPSYIENDTNITSERISNTLIIRTYDPAAKERAFWFCDKNGNNLRKVYSYNEKDDVRFYIDAKYQKLILIKFSNGENIVTEIDY